MNRTYMLVFLTTLSLTACGGGVAANTGTTQITAELPYATGHRNSTKNEKTKVEHIQLHIDTRKGFVKCMLETGYGPDYCERLAVREEMQLRGILQNQPAGAVMTSPGVPNPALNQYQPAWTDVAAPALIMPPAQHGYVTNEQTQQTVDLLVEAVAEISHEFERLRQQGE